MPSPVVKWVGGKRGLIEQMREHLPSPSQCAGYVAPFTGGEALFFCEYFGVRPAWLADTNPELIALYLAIRDDVEELVSLARVFEVNYNITSNQKAFYKNLASMDVSNSSNAFRGARMLFLNRACFNGLYRTNRAGQFNVAWGKKSTINMLYEDNLHEVSEALQGVELRCASFEDTFRDAPIGPGALVYIDPPYVPVSKTASFDSYGPNKFSWQKQGELLTLAEQAVDRGAIVVASNAWVPEIVSLYQRSRARFEVVEIKAARAVACKAESRADVGEMLATTWRK